MSQIETELKKLTDLDLKRGEDRQDFLDRLVEGINALSDDEFESMSEEASKWFNSACDAIEAKAKEIPDFPDLEQAKTTTRRRGAAAAETSGPYEPKVGDAVVALTKRGKSVEGKVVEVDDELLVIKTADGEEELQRGRLESVTLAGGATSKGSPDPEPEDVIKVGAKVLITTKRGKTAEGEIVEMDDDLVVIKTATGEEEFQRSRVESIAVAGGKAAEAPAGRGRRGAAAADPKDEPKEKKIPGGVTGRMRELIVEGLKEDGKMISKEDLGKAATKEKLEFKPATLDLVHGDFERTLNLLADAGLIKLKK